MLFIFERIWYRYLKRLFLIIFIRLEFKLLIISFVFSLVFRFYFLGLFYNFHFFWFYGDVCRMGRKQWFNLYWWCYSRPRVSFNVIFYSDLFWLLIFLFIDFWDMSNGYSHGNLRGHQAIYFGSVTQHQQSELGLTIERRFILRLKAFSFRYINEIEILF